MSRLEKYKLPGSKNKWFQVTRNDREYSMNRNKYGRKRLRVAFLINSFPLISETFILNQITGLIDRGHTVDIFATKYSSGIHYHEDIHKYGLLYRTHFLCDMPKGYFRRIIKLINLLIFAGGWKRPKVILRSLNYRKFGRSALSLFLAYSALPFFREKPYDILHCQFGFSGPLGLSLKEIKAFTGKLVISFRGVDITENLINSPGFYDDIFAHADCLLPVSKNFRRKLIMEGCCDDKIKVHYSGVNCSRFKFRERTRKDGEITQIVTVGRLVEKKGIAYAIRAIALALQSGRKLHYTIIGDGILRKDLQNLTELLRVDKSVTIEGWKTSDEVIACLEKAHILLAPSITSKSGDCEGIPNASKEAMAMGLPVLSTYHSGNPELIEDGVSGFLVPERDVYALAAKLEYLIDNPGVWPEIGKKGRKVIEDKFEINKLNDGLIETYYRLTTGDRRDIKVNQPNGIIVDNNDNAVNEPEDDLMVQNTHQKKS